jgi:hypothetical protein
MKFWNPSKRLLVCPYNTYYNDKEATKTFLWQLKRIGCKLVKEIKMPINLWHRFFLVKVPKFLSWDDDPESEGTFTFKDEKGRARLRVTAMQMVMNTHVWTKYLPQHEFTRNGKAIFVPCVIDLEKTDEYDETAAVVWKGKDNGLFFPSEMNVQAAKWLDENYPLWKDPLAYWS